MTDEIPPDLIERCAREAFRTDDIGGHLKPGPGRHTWENIPEIGRQNYRTLVRAVLAVAVDDLRRELQATEGDLGEARQVTANGLDPKTSYARNPDNG